MGRIILDCDLMRFPNSGLYHYCLNLGLEVNRLLDEKEKKRIRFYVPPREAGSFNDPANTIVERPYHRFIKPFLWDCKVWHAPFQLGRILPYQNKNIRVLFTIHDLNFLHEGVPEDERERTRAHIQKQIDRSDAIVCISEFTKSDVLKHCNTGSKPVYVIHNGTHSVGQPQLDERSYKPERKFLFGMGYVNKKKNYHVLIPLLNSNPELELLIAGKLDNDEYISMMKNIATELGVANRLKILGPISENEKAWYFKNCLAFMHPSLAEGFGAPVVESMQFGRPIFLSSLTSLPEIGADAAFFFKNFEPAHMQHVFAQGMALYEEQRMAEKIVRRGRDFDWRVSAAKYIEVYQSLMK